MRRKLTFVVALFLSGACLAACALAESPVFVPGAGTTAAKPWSNQPFLNDPDEFQFAIIADIHGGNRRGVFERAIGKINIMRPEFVLSVGDLINGYTDDPAQVDREHDFFLNQIAPLDMRFFFVPGNHDLTNEMMTGKWEERYGRSYYHFVYRDVLFLCLNSEDPRQTHMSDEQVAFVAETLAANASVRWTFVFLHKPLWEYNATGWEKIEEMLVDRPHTVLAGHHHSYIKYERHGRSYIRLATTGGGSDMAGWQVGKFDHITWVTMTDTGPVIANLDLEGILDEDLVTEELAAIIGSLHAGKWVAPGEIVVDDAAFRRATGVLEVSNPYPHTIGIHGGALENETLAIAPGEFAFDLAPGDSRTVPVVIETHEPLAPGQVAPPQINIVAELRLPDRPPITIGRVVELDVRGGWQGRQMVANGRFALGRSRWSLWANDGASLAVRSGRLEANVGSVPELWSVGAVQTIGTVKAGVDYRLTLRAHDLSGSGEATIQIKRGNDYTASLIIDGAPATDIAIPLTADDTAHAISFRLDADTDLTDAELVVFFGRAHQPRIDDISLREALAPGP